jgi:hypothetical protein
MKKRILMTAVMSAMLLIATAAYAPPSFETNIDYYYDDTFATWVGNYNVDCSGYVSNTGTVGSWRIFDVYNCNTGARPVHRCQQTDGMGGWIDVGCPPWDP